MTSPQRLRICFVAPNLYPVLAAAPGVAVIGGAEFRQALLARALAAAGHDVSVITQDFGQPAMVTVDGVRVWSTHQPRAGLPVLRYLHPRLSSVLRRLREVQADIFYQSSASHLTAVVAWHARKVGAHAVYSGASDTDFTRGQERIAYARDRWLFRWGLEHVHAIVAQTARQAALVRKHYARPAMLIPNAYSLPARRATPQGDLVLWVGGIRRIKRPDRFIALARAMPQYRFRMIGGAVGEDSTARAYFESMRASAAGVSNLEFMGFRPLEEVETHFDQARVFVNTSEHEGFPNTFLQAWARGIPTVSFFDAGAGADGSRPFTLVTDEQDAGRAIAALVADGPAREALSRACRTHFAEHHSIQRVLRQYETLFQQLGALPT
jgi:glycosyltransferase involved in cell wall biosynthesis